jgi:hypothetical protein
MSSEVLYVSEMLSLLVLWYGVLKKLRVNRNGEEVRYLREYRDNIRSTMLRAVQYGFPHQK